MTEASKSPLALSRTGGLALICGLLLCWLSPAIPARAAGSGIIAGKIVNATPGGSVPAGADILLGVFEGDALKRQDTTQADSSGAFRFDSLEVGEGITYSVATIYANAVYKSDPIRLTGAASEQTVELKVYEAVGTDPGLRAGEVFFVLDSVDADRQEITVSELVTLVNPSDRAFVPSTGSPSGPQDLVRFGLPAGARDLRPGSGLTPDEMVQIGAGFASFAPVAPGRQEFGFSYRLPYSEGHVSLDKSLPYGAELFEVLAPEGTSEVTGQGLAASQSVDLDSVRLRAWVRQNVPTDSRIPITLSGLPPRPLLSSALVLVGQPAVAPTLLALGLALGVLVAARVRLRRGAREALPPRRGPDGERIVEAIADLDDAFAAGSLSGADYRARRKALKSELQAQMARKD